MTDDIVTTPDGHRLAVHFVSTSVEHYTPTIVIEATLALFEGAIDLDPCAETRDPQKATVPAKHYFTREDDGLAQDWRGDVYMNPPYGRELPKWIAKVVDEYRSGRTTQAVVLVPCRTDTGWMRKLRDYPRCEVRGRLRFGGLGPAPFPSAIVYLGLQVRRFAECFRHLGDIWERRA